ncbi:2886_t:CDS:1, partial [Entrophospora sp. SA101]
HHQPQSDSSPSSHDAAAAAKPSQTSLSQQQHQQRHQNQPITFSSPNIYKSSLQLTTELEINKWWDNVI